MATTSLLLCGHAEAAVKFSMSTQAQNLQVLEDALLSYRGFPAPPLRSSGTLEVVTPDGVLRADKVHGEAGPFVRARGIQYAAHPEGKLRWQPPVPRGPWSGVLDATAYGDDCIQGPFLNRLQEIGPARMSERCLFLNVWAPVEPQSARGSLPVLVWIHGGSFTSGGTSHYGADRLFSYRRDFVLVTLNYRLGALGWLGGAAVAAESADGSAGNFGLQDSREALRWVARNAAAFGGDPARVAICGESAGASMVETHLAAPRSARLFSRAVLQSGAFDNYTTQADPELGFAALAAHAGCPTGGDGLACLRALPLRAPPGEPELMSALANTSAAGYFGPAVDGVELTEPPEVSAAAGRLNPVRGVLLGSTADEGRLLMPTTMPIAGAPFSTAAELRSWFRANFPRADPAALDALYASDAAADEPWGAAAHAYTDGQYLCPTARSARWLAAAAVAEVYTYRLEYAPQMYGTLGELAYWQVWCRDYARCANATARSVRVGHGADVPLLFHDARLNATDREVARTLTDYWLGFISEGMPSAGAKHVSRLPHWPASANATMRLGLVPTVAHGALRADICAFWDAYHPVPYHSQDERKEASAAFEQR